MITLPYQKAHCKHPNYMAVVYIVLGIYHNNQSV